jgi:outer membrane protein OmpA-like peptidoglycan-associated protein
MASAVSPQNRPLTYSYSSSAGTISGTGATATLTTTDAQPGPITVTCNVADDLGHTGTTTTTVTVATPPEPEKPAVTELCSEHFDRDTRRPARVDNEAKACLDDVALNMQKNSDAKLAIVGNAASKEKNAKKLASERAANTKAYLVGEKGIDASRITMYSGSQDSKSVNMTLVPEGATLDTTGDTPIQ